MLRFAMMRGAAVLGALVGMGPPGGEHEPTPVLELEWVAPDECGTEEEVRAAIVELVGRPLGEDASRTLRVQGKVARAEDVYVLDLRMSEGTKSTVRRVEASECRRLIEPAAVVVAIAVDPALETGGDVQVPEPPKPAVVVEAPSAGPVPSANPPGSGENVSAGVPADSLDSVVALPEDSEPEATRPRKSKRQVRAAIGARGGLGGVNLPGVGGIVEGSLGVLFGQARVDVAVLHVFPQRTELPGGGGGRFTVTAVRPEGCWTPGLRRLKFPLCVGPEIGMLRAEGLQVERREVVRHVWLAVVAGPGIAWSPIPRLALRARVDVVFQALRREFTLRGDSLFTTPVAGVRGLAGLEVHLP